MNMFDEARALRGTLEMCGITQGEMARRLGVSQSYIANKLRLLNHCENMQKKILDSGISERHARALLRLRDEGVREAALDRVCREKMNVAECEALVDLLYCSEAPSTVGKAERLKRIDAFQNTLRESLEVLSSLGVEARKRTSYYGNKTYITISIEE
ncbi:MAG: hypothetical protein J6K44_05290 [Clostridia bacterium]|nr:hypothetical protein [Clostridia bacterium]MBP3583441.1 hypothetical protein [Clostridia bacterium]